jgi:iron(III) transport system permease protein
MEALNDIGASEFLGVRTLTVAIYSTWVTRSDLPGAAQIAIAMLAVVLALAAMERWGRRRQRYANDAQHPTPLVPHRLRGVHALAALALCAIPVAVGFVVPTLYLVHAASARVEIAGLPPSILGEALTTVLLALTATTVAVVAGTLVAYAARTASTRTATALVSLGSIGYATPGTVVAIGLLPVLIGLDTVADAVTRSVLGVATGLLMLGTGLALVYAYVVRFLAITIGGAEAGFSKVSRSLDEAAATLGAGAAKRLWRIHLPLLRPAVATAAVLMFVDCMKELPATLLLRPIGVETLATHLYGEAARGTYEDGAIAALVIVVVGIGPVWVLARLGKQRA